MNIAIDLDGTLAHWRRPDDYAKMRADDPGWSFGVGEWIEGAQDALVRLLGGGNRVVVHTCRATWEDGGGTPAVVEFVRSGGFDPLLVVGQEWRGREDEVVLPDASMGAPPPPIVVNGEFSTIGAVTPEPPAAYPTPPTIRFAVGIWVGVGKPIAHAYVDDRGVTFDPEAGWDMTLRMLEHLGFPLAEVRESDLRDREPTA